MYLNEKEGVAVAGWGNITGLGVLPNDRVVFDGTEWALITSGGGIPNLQVVTDSGDTTNHTITTAGYITAGNVQATDGLFSGNVTTGSIALAGIIDINGYDSSQDKSASLMNFGSYYGQKTAATPGSTAIFQGNYGPNNNVTSKIQADGAAYFNGRVGIGTDSPLNPLHVETTTNTPARFASTTRYCSALFSEIDINKGAFIGLDNGDFRFSLGGDRNGTGSNEKMRIAANGKVGIGTDSPNKRLEVKDASAQIRATNINSDNIFADFLMFNDGNLYIDSRNDTEKGGFRFRTADDVGRTTRLSIEPNGNVGIGTDSPSSLLQVSSTDGTAYDPAAADGQKDKGATLNVDLRANTNSGISQILFTQRSTDELARIVATGGTSPALAFGTGTAERMRIGSDGNVGIGTDSPSSKLEVSGFIQSSQGLKFNDTDSNYGLFPLGSQTLGFNINGDEKVRITAGGNVGIGTDSPSADLQVGTYTTEGVRLFDTGYVQVREDGGSGGLECYRNGSNSAARTVRITTAGNATFEGKVTTPHFDLESLDPLPTS